LTTYRGLPSSAGLPELMLAMTVLGTIRCRRKAL